MKKKDIFILFLVSLSLILSLTFYNLLPNIIPIHWGINGEVDNYGPRYFIFLPSFIMGGIYLLFKFLPNIDPRKYNYKKHKKAYENIVFATIIFLFIMYLLTLLTSLGYNLKIDKIVPFLVGILFIIIGNYIPKSKSNFYFGIKTPWTLSNDTVWKKTHRLSGKLFIVSGLIISISSIFFNSYILFIIIIINVISIALIPTIMSYIFFKNIS
ncbi:MAG: SdpI family protein [Clostridium sp.]